MLFRIEPPVDVTVFEAKVRSVLGDTMGDFDPTYKLRARISGLP